MRKLLFILSVCIFFLQRKVERVPQILFDQPQPIAKENLSSLK